MKYQIGQKVKVGGTKGGIMTISEIKPNGEMTLIEENCTFYYHPGDCALIPIKEQHYEQLTLF